MCWWVEILAFFSSAPSFYTIHANSDSVISRVNHRTISGVTVSAFEFAARAITSLEVSTNLHISWLIGSDIVISAWGSIPGPVKSDTVSAPLRWTTAIRESWHASA